MKLRNISEMATLRGWQPTSDLEWNVFNADDSYLGIVLARNESEAVELWAKSRPEDSPAYAKLEEDDEDVAELSGTAFGSTQFRRRDIKSINSPKTKQAIENWLNSNNSPYEWIMHFEHPRRVWASNLERTRIQPTPGAITFVKTGNSGGDTLTPHMILHTIGHAVTSRQSPELMRLENLLSNFADEYNSEGPDYSVDYEGVRVLSQFLHMKAAFNTLNHGQRSFVDLEEIINELVGVYIKNGHVKFSPNKYCKLNVATAARPPWAIDLRTIADMQTEINNCIKNMLDNCVGEVIFDD